MLALTILKKIISLVNNDLLNECNSQKNLTIKNKQNEQKRKRIA